MDSDVRRTELCDLTRYDAVWYGTIRIEFDEELTKPHLQPQIGAEL